MLVLLIAYGYIERPGPFLAIGLGIVVGLATLVRTEAILLMVLLAAPVLWRQKKRRIAALVLCAAACLLVLTPWLARNWSEFDRFPLLSTNGGYTAKATNCDSTYFSSAGIGFVDHSCGRQSRCDELASELAESDCYGREGRAYVRDHLTRTPLVALARVEECGTLRSGYEPRVRSNRLGSTYLGFDCGI